MTALLLDIKLDKVNAQSAATKTPEKSIFIVMPKVKYMDKKKYFCHPANKGRH